MATFVRTTAINPSELDTKFEEHRLLIAAKANQIQADQLAEQIVQLNAEKMSRLGGSIALGPLYGVSANTSTGNALATVDDVVRLATEIANAIVAGAPSGTSTFPSCALCGSRFTTTRRSFPHTVRV